MCLNIKTEPSIPDINADAEGEEGEQNEDGDTTQAENPDESQQEPTTPAATEAQAEGDEKTKKGIIRSILLVTMIYLRIFLFSNYLRASNEIMCL